MLQGTGSDVGKSLLVAGLARLYARRGLAVRPFKPQNMSNNAAPALGPGDIYGEIGRAQALQARAAGIAPSVDMNPVLLKPQTETGAQIVVCGHVVGNADARAYHAMKPRLLSDVTAAYNRLCDGADLVLVEGAGSPAEVNLREGDIANMGFAEAVDLPVVLVGDIERGGVIAALVGTWTLLSESERRRLKGYVVNRFRGDPRLFDGAHPIIRDHTGMTGLGVVPWFEPARRLPAEDSASLTDRYAGAAWPHGAIRIAVPHLPRIANFDDLDPLADEPDVALRLIGAGEDMPADADMILLPGSKATRADLAELHARGWADAIRAARDRGAMVFGICGGYQMLGRNVADPDGIEGPAGSTPGIGLLDIQTVITGEKALRPVTGRDPVSGETVSGFEMHMGRTRGPDAEMPAILLDDGTPDGARSRDGRVFGSYIHGLFSSDGFRHAVLSQLAPGRAQGRASEADIEITLDLLADHLAEHLDTDHILAIARGS